MIVQVEKFMRKWNMVPEGGRVLVGVSGGADSVCLCLILYELSTKMNFSLEVIHVEHGIRGEESKNDAVFVEQLCKQRGIVCHIRNVDVPRYAKIHHLGEEEAARILRYQVFVDAAGGVEAAEGDVGDAEAGGHGFGGGEGFGGEDEVEGGGGHGLEVGVGAAGGELAGGIIAEGAEEGEEVARGIDGGEGAEEVDGGVRGRGGGLVARGRDRGSHGFHGRFLNGILREPLSLREDAVVAAKAVASLLVRLGGARSPEGAEGVASLSVRLGGGWRFF